MKIYSFLLLLVVIFLVFPKNVFAALFINEFSSGTSDSDWVEIYNLDGSSVDLSNYILRDSSTNKLVLSGTINGNAFSTFDWNSKLNNSGDTIRLLKSDESSVDQVVYGDGGAVSAPTGTITAGRSPDGSSHWILLSSASKGSSNNSSSEVPTPTPSPTNTPTPIPSPTPTKTPTPTPSPTNTPTPTPPATPTPTVTPKPTIKIAKPTISIDPNREGSTESAVYETVTPATQGVLSENTSPNDKASKDDPPAISAYNWGKLFIVMGVVLVVSACGILVYNKYRKEKEEGGLVDS